MVALQYQYITYSPTSNNEKAQVHTYMNIQNDACAKALYVYNLLHDVASGSDITPWNKMDKPLVVYRFNLVAY